jgi:type II secretory pathway pseudopilin PulG
MSPGSSRPTRRAGESGFTSIEIVVALAITASACLFAGAYVHTIVRREKVKAAVREVYAHVLVARLQAVRRDANVVLHVDVENRELTSWADAPPGNLRRDPAEPVLAVHRIPASVVFRSLDGPVGGAESVAFDGYFGDATLVDRIVFRSDGGLVVPQAANSRPPIRPSELSARVPSSSVNCPEAGCRGIFLADRTAGGPVTNLFRISVDDYSRIGKASLLKWLPSEHGGNGGERDFVPPPWKWME